ncbi:MAG: CocE/NonD family hydrolase [Anaerolineae bacterium]|nr:CocE/NonD family hydrolase [Anaerolineae bacterium]
MVEDDRAPWQSDTPARTISRRDVMRHSTYLTMRDGCKIAIDLYLPRQRSAAEQLPTILHQTRYYRRTALRWPFSWLHRGPSGTVLRFLAAGYAWVSVDARGSGASYGSRAMEWSPDEVRDGGEVVDWIVSQPWSNGVVGATGISYDGTAAEMLLRNRHPAVRAAAILYSLFDVYDHIVRPGGVRNDGFLRLWSASNDALDRNDLSSFLGARLGRRAGLAIRGVAPVDDDRRGRTLAAAVREHAANYAIYERALEIVCRDDVVSHGVRTDDFSPHAFIDEISASGAAVYSWSSWYDGRYTLAAVLRYLSLRAPGKRLLLGPWDHGGAQLPDPFSEDHTPHFDQTGEVLRFFDHHLRGIENGIEAEPPVHYYTVGEGRWKAAGTWPPPGFRPTPLYLAADGVLQTGNAPHEAGADRYVVDTSLGSGRGSRWHAQANMDGLPIRYPDRRGPDTTRLTYTSAPLETDVELTGHPVLTLYVRLPAQDAQLHAYLEDVAPDGTARYVTEGLFRACFRATRESPALYAGLIPHHTFLRQDLAPLTPGETAELAFDLMPISYLFRQGHAIRVAIAGADRDNFEVLCPSPPWIEVRWGGAHASQVVLPLRER